MEILKKENRKRGRLAAVGMYDGVHQGHRFLINFLREEAAKRGLTPSIVTFDTHPMAVIKPMEMPALLSTRDRKEAWLKEAGVEDCIVLGFDDKMRRMTAQEFLKMLKSKYCVKALVLGYNNSVGHDHVDNVEKFQEIASPLNMEIIGAPEYKGENGNVSSSRIREYLLNGELKKANAALGRPYELRGRVVTGDQVGRAMGYPTANLVPAEDYLLIPKPGVYAVRVITPDGERRVGILNIGFRPTLKETTRQDDKMTIEVHILDYTGYLYDEEITVEFVEYLREERNFRSLDKLKEQLAADAKQAMKLVK